MRIAEIHWAFAPTIGGVETHLAVLGPGLAARGHQVRLLCGMPQGAKAVDDYQGMTVERTRLLDLNAINAEQFLHLADEINETMENFLLRFQPDIIHVHNLHYFSPVPLEAVVAYRHRHRVPIVLTAHNTWHDALFTEMSTFAGNFDAIIAVSHFISRDMASLGYPTSRMTVVHHGVTPDWITNASDPHYPFPELKGSRLIFHPARMGVGKGTLTVLEAFATVLRHHPRAALLLAGSSQTVDWNSLQQREIGLIQERIAALGISKRVFYRPFSWPEMAGIYDSAEVVCYPSINPEPFGIVVIEAMARGRPVIVSDSGGMPELIEAGHSGLIVEPGSAPALADAIRDVLDRPQWAANLAQTARRRVAQHFTAETMIERTEQILMTTVREMAAPNGTSFAS